MAYPKQMINDAGEVVLAKQSVHEADLRRQGFYDLPEPENEPVEAPAQEGCPSCEALRVEIEDLKGQLAKALEGIPAPVKRGRKPKE